jgi:small subunit ribosomal protein S2
MSVVSMKQLLEAGVHFGHQTHKWNPKMKKYIFIKRNGIHILDLKQTVDAINDAYQFVKDIAGKGEFLLFVGTKKQAQDAVKQAAEKASVFFVNNRWYGGMLTNMSTIRKSIEKMEYFEQIVTDGTVSSYTKLEQGRMKRKHDKIEGALGGIRGMNRQPGAVFIVDTEHEEIAVAEARKLGIPIIGMVDTNCNPDVVDYVIPSNDDAIRAIYLIADIIANAVIEGKQSLAEGVDHAAPLVIPEDLEASIEEEEEKPVVDVALEEMLESVDEEV